MKTTTKTFFASILLIGALLFTASCEGLFPAMNDPDNFVKLSISNVSEGKFTIDFQCGKNTETVEYAVCYAVNMKTDSVAFMAGELENIDRVTPQEDGTASVSFDFSEPLDFGPYTVYARAISESGQASRFVKRQVCALTTGFTVEYLSRAIIEMKASYHGPESIRQAGIITQYEIDNDYEGSIDAFLQSQIAFYTQYPGTPFPETDRKYQLPVGEVYNKWGRFGNGMYIFFLTTDGTEITGAFTFEIPLLDEEPDIPLPDDLIIDDFIPSVTTDQYGDTLYTLTSKIYMGNNTEVFGAMFLDSDSYNETLSLVRTDSYYDGLTDEEIFKSLFIGTGSYFFDRSLFINYHDTEVSLFTTNKHVSPYFGEKHYLIACPANSNFEVGTLIIKEFIFPEKEEFPEPVPEENPIRPETGMDHAGIISGLQPSQRFNCR